MIEIDGGGFSSSFLSRPLIMAFLFSLERVKQSFYLVKGCDCNFQVNHERVIIFYPFNNWIESMGFNQGRVSNKDP